MTGAAALLDVCKRFCREDRHDDACLALTRVYNALSDIGNEAGHAWSQERELSAVETFAQAGRALKGNDE